jgi:hypothetical protein
MSEDEEIERYQKLLQDWKPSAPTHKPSHRPAPQQAVARQQVVSRPVETPSNHQPELASPGAILLLNERTLAIYQRAVPEKEYHLVLVLAPNGAVKLQGLALQAHQIEELGKLPPQFFDQLQSNMRWSRDLIVFHCYRYEDVCRVPAGAEALAQSEAHHTPVPDSYTAPTHSAPARPEPDTTPDGMPNRRGQRLQIKFGANVWEAVYWGKDAQNHVVAHQTYQKWALMHLDLDRFANGLVIDPVIDDNLIAEIERNLLEQ